ncbi:MAG: MBOAT family protein [Acetanaerobacterium sp.]
MIFANLFFIYLFLPLNIVLYFLSKNKNYRNIVLVAFSLFFYAWGEPIMIWVLLASVMIDFTLALVVERYRGTPRSKAALAASVVLNLGVLCIFKYSAFLVQNLNAVLPVNLPVPAAMLPIGISFYTFQMLSYMVDVYRGAVAAQRSPLKFLMYVSMYHQLVAGPIVRYSHIAEEIETRRISATEVGRGITRFIVGLSKKVIIANAAGKLCALYLDGDLSAVSVAGAWFGLLMFTLQIYFDFSGYSDMAIGLGMIFGFHYHENFDYPYISASATEFWRRWHISLGSFFRDYVYIPLGGNRKRQYLNLAIVWFLTGLWHGASWNFILWGLYFGLLVILEKLFLGKLLARIPRFFAWLYLMLAVVLGWALFYFTDLTRLGQFFGVLFGAGENPLYDMALGINVSSNLVWIIVSVLCTLPIVPWVHRLLGERLYEDSPVYTALDFGRIVVNVALLSVCTMLLVGQGFNPFLYYRF